MADYSTNTGFSGMWLLVAAVGVAIILTLIVFAGGSGTDPGTPTSISTPASDPALTVAPETAAPAAGTTAPAAGN